MGLKTYYRWKHTREERSRRLLETWLAAMPAGRAWVGTFGELEAVLSLVAIKEALEDPARLLLDL